MSSPCLVNLVLHAHLPYVRHLEYPKFLEENWLFESLNETYIPLLKILYKLEEEKKNFHLTISFSPTLCTMLTDQPLQERFVSYMNSRIELGEKEIARTRKENPQELQMARYYHKLSVENLAFYEKIERNILNGFIHFQQSGNLEIAASAATNAYLPLYQSFPNAIRAQIDMGVKSHRQFFGTLPSGFWLPECGYYPGLENLLEEYGISWCQLPSHSVFTAETKVESAGFAPVLIGESNVKGFVRDWSLTNLVWSNTSGYPCDADYRDFYKDIGYELPMEYVRPYIHEPSVRVFTGYKYWAITGFDVEEKKYYNIAKAKEKAALHASNFLYHIRRKGIRVGAETSVSPVINLCFDAELFGHRWFEGLYFLEEVLRASSTDDFLNFTTPSATIKSGAKSERAALNECSWGDGGYSDPWLDGTNNWVYRHTQKAILRLEELAGRFPHQSSLKGRFLNQAAREVLLAMASDWPYIIHDKTSVTYAEQRVKNHLGSFNVVYSNMCRNAVNTEWLVKSEQKNSIFPEMDYNIFAPQIKVKK